ncbi:unnamed protein product [Phaeothamnion confervicola]
MKAAMILASSLGSASAFVNGPAPLQRAAVATRSSVRSASTRMDASPYLAQMPGKPFGGDFIFDPLGLSADLSEKDVKKWRESELKHGRVAMLGALGIVVQEIFHPFFGAAGGPAIYHFQEIEARFPIFWLVALFGIGIVEGETIVRGWEKKNPVDGVAALRDDYIPGDLGLDPFDVRSDAAELFNSQTKELNNGRLAMLAVAGQVAQELVNNTPILENLGLA